MQRVQCLSAVAEVANTGEMRHQNKAATGAFAVPLHTCTTQLAKPLIRPGLSITYMNPVCL